MSLIQCAECGKEISDSASACPGCGAPITVRKKNGRVAYTDQEVSVMLSKKKKTSHLLHLILCIPTVGLWSIMWFLVAISNASENSRIDRLIAKGKKA